MTLYQYNGEQELVFPTLGITVRSGDIFEAPIGLVVDGLSIATKGKKTIATLPDDFVITVEATDSEPVVKPATDPTEASEEPVEAPAETSTEPAPEAPAN